MPDTRITKERLKNHWIYSSWKYLLMIVIFAAGWNLTYSVTEYKPPREKRLEMYFLGTSYSEENIQKLATDMAPQFVGTKEGDMEQLNFFAMNYGGSDDTYGPQVLMTRLASQEGDVYMVDEATLKSFVAQDLALPLDEYVNNGALDMQGQDMDTITLAAPTGEDDSGNVTYGDTRHVYAVSAQPLYGMISDDIIDNRGMYLVVMSYTDKPDACIKLIDALITRFRADKPDWLVQQEEKQKTEISQLPSELTVDTLESQATAQPSASTAPQANDAAQASAQPEATAAATALPTATPSPTDKK